MRLIITLKITVMQNNNYKIAERLLENKKKAAELMNSNFSMSYIYSSLKAIAKDNKQLKSQIVKDEK